MNIDPLPEFTAEDIPEMDRRLEERSEMKAAIRTLQQRAERDAELLVLLKMAMNYTTDAGKYAHTAGIEAARAINGEAS